MTAPWQQWAKRPETEPTLVERARGALPPMESTKQLVQLVAGVYRPGMRVLDVGCNVGHYLRGLRALDPALDYTGVDAYAHYVERAREIFRDDRCAAFHVRDVFEPLFPDTPFDIVYCCNVLLHLPDFRRPVRNLLASTRGVLLVRTLLGEHTTVVKRAVAHAYDDAGEPLDFVYQNTWETGYFTGFVEGLGWGVEVLEDEFDPGVLAGEHATVKRGRGTRVVEGRQADGNILFNWTWAKITRA